MHPEVREEQAYFDHALELRERLDANLTRAANEAADPKTARELRRQVGALGVVDPSVAVAFGRIDVNGSRWYIGKGAIWDEDNELVVVNWQAPVAAPFYRATPDEPAGLDARRIYRCVAGNRIRDIDEQVFAGLQQAILHHTGQVPSVADPPPSNGSSSQEIVRHTGSQEVVRHTGSQEVVRHTGSQEVVRHTGSQEVVRHTGSHPPVRHTGPVDVAFGAGVGEREAAPAAPGRGIWPQSGLVTTNHPGPSSSARDPVLPDSQVPSWMSPQASSGMSPPPSPGMPHQGPASPAAGSSPASPGAASRGPAEGAQVSDPRSRERRQPDAHPSAAEGAQVSDPRSRERRQPDAHPSATEMVPQVSDALLEALGRARSGELSDIVATIQAAQYEVITRDIEQLLVVQGGPGTGKTVVGLHRASWMLYHRRDSWQPNDVLIVGPNPAFIRYISSVLPSLGDEAVVQLAVTGLGPRIEVTRTDPVELRRLKGDRRMQRLLLRALRNRQKPQRGPIDLTVAGRTVRLDGERVVARAHELAGQPHNEARRSLRAFVVDEVQTFFSRRGLRGLSGIDDVAQAEATREIDNYLERIWPAMTPQKFLVDLFSTHRRLEAAGLGLLTTEEISMLTIPEVDPADATWSEDDIPLLDLADALLNGSSVTYEHIVVDEAQDLSPMQLESIRRRSRTGWMTVLGDLAQATSPWSSESWEEIVLHLRHDRVPTEIVELSIGYRLPREVHDLAMRLLPEISPRLGTPEAVRASGQQVRVLAAHVGDVAWRVVEEVHHLLMGEAAGLPTSISGGLIGVIVPDRDREAVVRALDDAGLNWSDELVADAGRSGPAAPNGSGPSMPIVVLGATQAKGLEFDDVIVVEPGEVAGESTQGLRALFVALTRTTNRLSLVHAEPLPSMLEVDSPLPRVDPPHAPQQPLPVMGEAPAMATYGSSFQPPAAYPEPTAYSETASPFQAPSGYAEPASSPWEPVAPAPASAASPAVAPQEARLAPVTPPNGIGPASSTNHPPGSTAAPYETSHSGGHYQPASSSAGALVPDSEHAPVPGPAPKHTAAPSGGLETMDRAMARAVAGQLADTLVRYITPSLVPLVLEELGTVLEERDQQQGQLSGPQRSEVEVLDVRDR